MKTAALFALSFTGAALLPLPIRGQAAVATSSHLPGSVAEVYKTISPVKLRLYRYGQNDPENQQPKPAIVFFFGGGWRNGTPKQFQHHCRYFASRGMIAMTADYRVASRHRTQALQCVLDAKSAVRWIRQNALRLGVDSDRIIAAGGSAGGHIAACAGLVSGIEEHQEDLTTSSRPNAMILFNPALVLDNVQGRPAFDPEKLANLKQRLGTPVKNLSPIHHVKANAPPALILHGQADKTVPYWTAQAFQDAMLSQGNQCQLLGYSGQPHAFFNFGRKGNEYFRRTLQAADRYLVALGYLQGEDTVERYLAALEQSGNSD